MALIQKDQIFPAIFLYGTGKLAHKGLYSSCPKSAAHSCELGFSVNREQAALMMSFFCKDDVVDTSQSWIVLREAVASAVPSDENETLYTIPLCEMRSVSSPLTVSIKYTLFTVATASIFP